MHTNRGRPAGMTRERIRQRLVIAKALVQGITIAAVARRLGVSRSWASREANAPETRLMLAALFARHAERMGQLLDQALTTIDRAFEATRQIRLSDGQLLEIPDHRIRLEAAGVLVRLLATGLFSFRSGEERRDQTQLLRKGQEQHREQHPPTLRGRGHYKVQLESIRLLIRIFNKLRPYGYPAGR
jgi:Homeodomain-like domain